MRTIIDLPASQLEGLDWLCRRDGISRAEAIRRAVALMMRDCRSAEPQVAFGLWRDRTIDGLQYQETVRSEWDGRS